MANNIQWQERIGDGCHVTEFEWILSNWSLLFDAKYKNGFQSGAFKLNGTDGYTCTLLIRSTSPHLTMTFSCTENILAIGVNGQMNKTSPCKYVYSAPYEKNSFPILFNRQSSYNTHYMSQLDGDEHDTYIVSLKISIVRPIDVIPIITDKKDNTNSGNSVDSSTHILANLKGLLVSKSFSDITLVLRDQKYSAHKTILAAQSKVFERTFATAMKEQKENCVKVIDTDEEVFAKFLNYLYTGELTDLKKNVEKMIVVADYYQIDHLKTICENLMMANLCEKNIVQYVIIANELNCSKLEKKALTLIENNRIILKTVFEENHETLSRLKQILTKNSIEK
ncbi:speckle-type POZ protein-like [Venturia canescens]|uniref:speckle-type POZ protein-like n=1 Tax=Venturia canescens TaxID=32260 RepID=UPI001C9D4231|nr:speckle-type POZ protein-like [Venturia canescens]